MKAWKHAAIVAAICAGIFVAPWISQQIQNGQLPVAAPLTWRDSWVFQETSDGYGFNETFWDSGYPTVTVVVFWDWNSGSQTWFTFKRVDMTDQELEIALGTDLYESNGTPRIFVMHDRFVIPNYMTIEAGVRVLFFDRTAWVMNQVPWDSTYFTESKITTLVQQIITTYGGSPA